MNFNLPFDLTFSLSRETTFTAFYISLVLLGAVLADLLLKSLIRVPKHFDNKRARSYAAFIRNLITVLVYVTAAYVIFTLLKIDLTPLLASASVIGVVIGISARSTIEDILSGLFLLSLDSLAIGDYVKFDDTPGDSLLVAEGVVERIGIRTTAIRSFTDGALYVIPNGRIKKFINYSRPKSALQVNIILKADNDIDKVLKCANTALKHLQEDEAFAHYIYPDSHINGIEDFQTFGHMTVQAAIFTSPSRRLDAARKYRYYIKKEFEKNKIKFN